MDSIHNRSTQIERTLLPINKEDLKGLKKFILKGESGHKNDFPPNKPSSITLETINKSCPYVEITRDYELDKDGNPSQSFGVLLHGIYPKPSETYIGTFGKDEILQAIDALNIKDSLISNSDVKRPSNQSPEMT